MSKNPFPATLEVERELYYSFDYSMIPSRAMFPAPLEVDRYLYLSCEERMLCLEINCFRPLSRQIGSYTNTQKFKKIVASSVSGPSRGRQVSIHIILRCNHPYGVWVSVPSRGRQGAITQTTSC